ncbi:MAG: hypothetical protein KDA78_21205, partial [Planctomycetaceae bacterium]|nr:hypothetical protein [Planctomycetaceae bacterium]
EKDELVAALTARLEQAAEQLDRLHRLGVDRALINCATTPLPPPPPRKPKPSKTEPLHEDLQKLIEQWDALQANNSFGRIEIQIGEVRDLIVQLSQSVREQQAMVPQMPISASPPIQPAPQAPAAHPDFEDGHVELPDNLFGEQKPQTTPASPAYEGDLSDWDSIKQNLLSTGGEGAAHAMPHPVDGEGAYSSAEEQSSQTDVARKEAEEAAFLAELAELIPEGLRDIDLDNASHNEISRALEERDEYISRLLNYITAVHKIDMNWDIISQGPEALHQRLLNLQSQLETKLRLAEVSIAVERAKLGRDEMRIRQLESNAQRVLKRLGLDPTDPQSMAKIEKLEFSQAAGSDQVSGGNWRRLLGLGKEETPE